MQDRVAALLLGRCGTQQVRPFNAPARPRTPCPQLRPVPPPLPPPAACTSSIPGGPHQLPVLLLPLNHPTRTLCLTHLHPEHLVHPQVNLPEHVVQGAWDNAAVTVPRAATRHGECLAGASLRQVRVRVGGAVALQLRCYHHSSVNHNASDAANSLPVPVCGGITGKWCYPASVKPPRGGRPRQNVCR